MIGNQIIQLEYTESTNQYAIDLLSKSRPPEGTVISAIEQLAGRGQYGRTWESNHGENINLSIILYPGMLEPTAQFYLSMVVSLGIFSTLTEYISEGLYIKWPNDILYKNQKICGTLIQNSISGKQIVSSVIGIGMNINQSGFKSYSPPAISVKNILGNEIELSKVKETLFRQIDKYYSKLKQGSIARIKKSYLNKLLGFNERRSFKLASGERIVGEIVDVKENGLMAIDDGNTVALYNMKEIKINL